MDDVGRDDDQQLGLLAQIVARAEQAAENRQVHQAGNAVDRLLRLVEIRPAEAIEPPDGNSTVVSFLRVRKPGIDVLAIESAVRGVDVGDFGGDAQLDAACDSTTGVKFSVTP